MNATTRYAVAVGDPRYMELLFGPKLERLDSAGGDLVGPALEEFDSPHARAALANVDVLLTGWGTPALTDEVLAGAPGLRAVIHAGGIASTLVPEAWRERLSFSVSALDNSRPVAEYTLAMILLAGKRSFAAERMYRSSRAYVDRNVEFAQAGNRDRTVGILAASRIGRMVIELLHPFDWRVLVHDPALSALEAKKLAVTPVGLDELFETSEVVSIHAPLLPSTRGLVGARQLALLPDGATLINTARGEIVDQDALIVELRSGRIEAVLDVTEPDPLPPDSPLWELPGVTLTPHIAGSMGREIGALGAHVVAELARYSRGEAFAEPEPRVVR